MHGGGQAAVVVGHPAYGGCRHAADTDGHAEGDAGGEAYVSGQVALAENDHGAEGRIQTHGDGNQQRGGQEGILDKRKDRHERQGKESRTTDGAPEAPAIPSHAADQIADDAEDTEEGQHGVADLGRLVKDVFPVQGKIGVETEEQHGTGDDGA